MKRSLFLQGHWLILVHGWFPTPLDCLGDCFLQSGFLFSFMRSRALSKKFELLPDNCELILDVSNLLGFSFEVLTQLTVN